MYEDKNDITSILLSFCNKTNQFLDEFHETIKDVLTKRDKQTVEKVKRILADLSKLGEYNWIVVSSDMDISIADKGEKEVNKYFIDYMQSHKEFYYRIKDRVLSSDLLSRKKHVFEQIFWNIEQNNYSISCIGMSTMLEYLLVAQMNYNWHTIMKKAETFVDNADEISLNDDYILCLIGISKFLNKYIADTENFIITNEPKYVNRHWIAHGRIQRTLSDEDTYQMLFAIYAFIIISESEIIYGN